MKIDPSLTLCAQDLFMPHNNAVHLALEYPPCFIDEETEAQTNMVNNLPRVTLLISVEVSN